MQARHSTPSRSSSVDGLFRAQTLGVLLVVGGQFVVYIYNFNLSYGTYKTNLQKLQNKTYRLDSTKSCRSWNVQNNWCRIWGVNFIAGSSSRRLLPGMSKHHPSAGRRGSVARRNRLLLYRIIYKYRRQFLSIHTCNYIYSILYAYTFCNVQCLLGLESAKTLWRVDHLSADLQTFQILWDAHIVNQCWRFYPSDFWFTSSCPRCNNFEAIGDLSNPSSRINPQRMWLTSTRWPDASCQVFSGKKVSNPTWWDLQSV